METPVPDYQELGIALDAADVPMSAAEAHGIVTGACCVPGTAALAPLFFSEAQPTAEVEHVLRLLTALQEDMQRRLAADEFDFEPMLPATPQDPAQVEALAQWARGLLLGLAGSGVRDPRALPDEASEFLLDVMQIGEAEADAEFDGEQQERDIAEIVEYLRAGVQLVHDELHQQAAH